MRISFHLAAFFLCMAIAVHAKEKKSLPESLASYLQRMQQTAPAATSITPGSLWVDNGPFAATTVDYKAAHVGDLITIVVVQDVTAQNSGNVSTARTFSANSGISALPAG